MANNGRINRSSILRLLNYGLDHICDQNGKTYQGPGNQIFKDVSTDKAFYEVMQLAGMGMAGRRGEGEAITFDSVDQHWVFRQPVYDYSKSARITREARKDNKYEDMMPRISREIYKALQHAKDQQMANILINGFSGGPVYGDGKALMVSDHPVQAGGTYSNVLAVAEDLSESCIENLDFLIAEMVNDDGLISQYEMDKIVLPYGQKYEIKRILGGDLRYATSDNDVNALNKYGTVQDVVLWKRLSDPDAVYATTNADYGLVRIVREGIYTEEDRDYNNHDTIVTAGERYQPSVVDSRGIVGTPGS